MASSVCTNTGAVVGIVVVLILSVPIIYTSIIAGFDSEYGYDLYDKQDDLESTDDSGMAGFSERGSLCHSEIFPEEQKCYEEDGITLSETHQCGCPAVIEKLQSDNADDPLEGSGLISGENDERYSSQVGDHFCCEEDGDIDGFWSAWAGGWSGKYFQHIKGAGYDWYSKPSFWSPVITITIIMIIMVSLFANIQYVC